MTQSKCYRCDHTWSAPRPGLRCPRCAEPTASLLDNAGTKAFLAEAVRGWDFGTNLTRLLFTATTLPPVVWPIRTSAAQQEDREVVFRREYQFEPWPETDRVPRSERLRRLEQQQAYRAVTELEEAYTQATRNRAWSRSMNYQVQAHTAAVMMQELVSYDPAPVSSLHRRPFCTFKDPDQLYVAGRRHKPRTVAEHKQLLRDQLAECVALGTTQEKPCLTNL